MALWTLSYDTFLPSPPSQTPKLRSLYDASPHSLAHNPMLIHGETIDDSEWNTFSLQLSDGWNMARPSQVEALNGTEVEDMREYGLGNFYNSSIS